MKERMFSMVTGKKKQQRRFKQVQAAMRMQAMQRGRMERNSPLGMQIAAIRAKHDRARAMKLVYAVIKLQGAYRKKSAMRDVEALKAMKKKYPRAGVDQLRALAKQQAAATAPSVRSGAAAAHARAVVAPSDDVQPIGPGK